MRMCVHKHATMCEGGHNFVDFFPPTFHGFCNQTLPVRHASPSIKFHYPTRRVVIVAYKRVEGRERGKWFFPLLPPGTELRPSSVHGNVFTCWPASLTKSSHVFLLIPEVKQSVTEFCTRNHWNWSNWLLVIKKSYCEQNKSYTWLAGDSFAFMYFQDTLPTCPNGSGYLMASMFLSTW